MTGDDVEVVVIIIVIVIVIILRYRIFGMRECVDGAKQLNRSTVIWGFLGFIIPTIAMIWISYMKPKIKWDDDIND